MAELVPLSLSRWNREEALRLIGIEVRFGWGMQTEELALLPLNILIPRARPESNWHLPCTLHTSVGDVGFDVPVNL